jgi:hypothetical protein
LSSPESIKGGLICLSQSSLSEICIDDVIVEDVEASNTWDGGVMYIEKSVSVRVKNSVFRNIHTARIGGAFVIGGVEGVVFIMNNTFDDISAKGHGGAIYFSEGAEFHIESTTFRCCVSKEGCGGGFASFSTRVFSSYFCIKDCEFSGNGGYENKGIDIYDGSNKMGDYYTSDTVINSYSTSTGISPYTLFIKTKVL